MNSRAIDYGKYAANPMQLASDAWPDVRFYGKQVEIIESVLHNRETYVVAGHQLGKDFVTGFICLWYFLSHDEVRVITTSVKDDHLRVLWGEIGRYLDTCQLDIASDKGGPLVVNHRNIRKAGDSISYLLGTVSAKGEGMAGHHAKNTLLVIDEASGVADVVYERATSWAKKVLVIGNPYPSGNNFFEQAVKGGDVA